VTTTTPLCGNDRPAPQKDRGSRQFLEALAREHGTPLFIIDHAKIRENYREFKKYLPKIQVYFAVKANSNPAIVKTLFDEGSSFDVASMPEFMIVYEFIRDMPAKERQDFIWDRIIYANTIKPIETLEELNQYKPLVTFDNIEELKKIRLHAPQAGLVLRLRVPNTGSMVELSSKFGADPGEAVDLIKAAFELGLVVEGLSFHVGSQCYELRELRGRFGDLGKHYRGVREPARAKDPDTRYRRGFPGPVQPGRPPARRPCRKTQLPRSPRLFPADMQILAEPGRFLVANACTLVAKVVGKAHRDGKPCYYINDGVYHTYSGQVFDHCTYPVLSLTKRARPGSRRSLARPAMRSIRSRSRPSSRSSRSATSCIRKISGRTRSHLLRISTAFPPAKVVHINR